MMRMKVTAKMTIGAKIEQRVAFFEIWIAVLSPWFRIEPLSEM
jgi:hypothetical protein